MKITRKGQITPPHRIRQRFGSKPGTQVQFVKEGDKLVLVPQRRETGSADTWLAKARGGLRPGVSTDELMKLTRGED